MILAPQALSEQLAHVLDGALTALLAASEDGSEIAQFGSQDALKLLHGLGAVYLPPRDNDDLPPTPTIPLLPPLFVIDCDMCQGAGCFGADDTGPAVICAACGGTGEAEVCSGCRTVPSIRNGLEHCPCKDSMVFEFEAAA